MPLLLRRLWTCTVATLILLSFCALLYIYADQSVAYAAKGLQGSLIYSVSLAISLVGQPKLWLVLTGIGLVVIVASYLKNRRWLPGLACFCLSNLLAASLGNILKYLLGRYRPQMLFDHQLYGFHFFANSDNLFSCPSGHTFATFASMTVFAYLYPRYRWLFWGFAVLVGLSRIVVTRHYPSDVLFGAYIGILSAYLSWITIKPGARSQQLR
jgi:membrane-associated phospholipid phosphatase